MFGVMWLGMPFPRPKKTDSEAVLYEYAVGALARRMRSVAELKRLLRNREWKPIPNTARRWLNWSSSSQGSGLSERRALCRCVFFFPPRQREVRTLRVVTDLKAKGVHGEVIDKAVDSVYDEVNEEEQARDYLQRKR